MKKIILLFTALLLTAGVMQSQVKIGERVKAQKGAVLDLNSATYQGGLLLPNVDITDLGKIPTTFSDASVRGLDDAPALAGLIVWNTHPGSEGVYMWNGANWQLLTDNSGPTGDCSGAPSVTSITGFSGVYDLNAEFVVTCDAATSGVTLYTWTVPSGLSIVSGNGTKAIRVKAVTAGTYNGSTINCTVANACGSVARTAGSDVLLVAPYGSGSFTGRTGFDVAQVNDAGECGTLSYRQAEPLAANGIRADFTNVLTYNQTYTFTPSGAVSNVRFIAVEASPNKGQIIQSITGGNSGNNISTAVSCDIVYKSDLNGKASGKTSADALAVDIYVVYNDNGNNTGTDKFLKLTAKIRDCAYCGAYTASGDWLNFMCYNLGADPTLVTPDQIKAASTDRTSGYYYFWGSQRAILSSGELINVISGNGWGDDGKKGTSDPCPAGWRVPSRSQWDLIFGATVMADNPDSPPETALAWHRDTETTGLQVGRLFYLPTAGIYHTWAVPTPGFYPDEFRYWTRTTDPVPSYHLAFTLHINLENGMIDLGHVRSGRMNCSIRCVEE